jgi:quercetin dioxygenase-like cupin family protein
MGETEMTDWKVVTPAEGEKAAKVELAKTYNLQPGDAHLYPAGAIHAPYRDGPTRLIRIEGVNTDNLTRTRIEPV